MQVLKVNNKTISTPLLTIIKDIKSQLHNGKLQTIRVMGDNIRVSCVNPEHKGGHEAKASADIYIGDSTDNVQYGKYHCFTCSMICDFVHFVAMAFDETDEWARKWLIDNYADGEAESYQIDLDPIILNKSEKKEYLDESILNKFENFHPYMTKRKLAKNIIEKFEIKYDPKTKCLVFPVRDEKGKLIMLTRRSVVDKTFIIDKNKEKPLYLLYYMLEHNIKEVMITEGQIDALTACGYGMPCVATMGAISSKQIDTLNKSGIRVVYTMFDNDDAGVRFTNKLLAEIRKDILVIPVKINIPNKKDINDLSDAEFWQCVNKADEISI